MIKLWFRSRRYGWGWEPASIEGWLVLLAFIAAVVISAIVFVSHLQAGGERGALASVVVVEIQR